MRQRERQQALYRELLEDEPKGLETAREQEEGLNLARWMTPAVKKEASEEIKRTTCTRAGNERSQSKVIEPKPIRKRAWSK